MVPFRVRARTFGIAFTLAVTSLGLFAAAPASAAAGPTTWDITVGGGDFTQATSLNRFYPNDITVHPGDSVSFAWRGFHTVTFNPPPNFWLFEAFGVVGSTILDSHTTFVNAPPFTGGEFFDLTIGSGLPNGAYAFHCSLHQFMKGVIKVTRGNLPKTNAEYTALGHTQMLADAARAVKLDSRLTRDAAHQNGEALAGAGDKVAEFIKYYPTFPTTITTHVGDELTFSDRDLHDPHTVTFGPVEGDQSDPATGVFPSGPGDPNAFDGTSPLNSGLLFHQSQYDYWNLAVSPLAAAVPRTEFSVTFTTPGVYNFYCDIHGSRDSKTGKVSGMSGTITVLPAEGDA